MTVADDGSVADSTKLFRRITQQWLVRDDNLDCVRVSSAAFSSEGLSVVLEDTLLEGGRQPSDVLSDHPDEYLVSITAELVREHDQAVVRTPTDEEPAHGEVVGKKTKGRRRAFAAESLWVVPPPDACPDGALTAQAA
jgi:hypothetical protein